MPEMLSTDHSERVVQDQDQEIETSRSMGSSGKALRLTMSLCHDTIPEAG